MLPAFSSVTGLLFVALVPRIFKPSRSLPRVTDWALETTARALRLTSDKMIREHGFWEQKALHKLYSDNAHGEQRKILVLQERWKINPSLS